MLAAGSVIAGKYRLEESIGEGATGTVWKAEQLGLGRAVAVKLLHATHADREGAAPRFEREARVAASLEHPGSVAVLDFGAADGVLYLVMELLVGESLRDRLDRGPVRLDQAVQFVQQIASALAGAHRIRLVHRDIKPGNVFIEETPEGPRAKVVDFGLAFIADAALGGAVGRMTEENIVAGTPAYMSPEQIRGAPLGPATDVYSLGCLFYELIAGHPPFTGTRGDVLTRHAYSPVIPLRDLDGITPPPPAIDALIQAMLAKSPPQRPSPNRIIAALAGVQLDIHLDGDTERAVGGRSTRVLPRPSRRDVSAAVEPVLELSIVGGALASDVEAALLDNGIQPITDDPGARGLVWAPGATIDRLTALAAAGALVLTDVPADGIGRLPALVRAGVTDAIARPIDGDELARRVRRAARLAPRGAT